MYTSCQELLSKCWLIHFLVWWNEGFIDLCKVEIYIVTLVSTFWVSRVKSRWVTVILADIL